MSRTLGAAGEALIKGFEKLCLVGYADEGGVPTAGWGHTGHGVTIGAIYTLEQAQAWFKADTHAAETIVDIKAPLGITQNQFDALVSFTYNVGEGAFIHSTLLQRLRAGDIAGAAAQFALWDHDGGHVSAGLDHRRAAERDLFLLA